MNTFVENFDMKLQDGVPSSCVHCFSVVAVIMGVNVGPEAQVMLRF